MYCLHGKCSSKSNIKMQLSEGEYQRGNKLEYEVDRSIAKYNMSIQALYPLLQKKYILKKCTLENHRTTLKHTMLCRKEEWVVNRKNKK